MQNWNRIKKVSYNILKIKVSVKIEQDKIIRNHSDNQDIILIIVIIIMLEITIAQLMVIDPFVTFQTPTEMQVSQIIVMHLHRTTQITTAVSIKTQVFQKYQNE